MQGTRQMQNTNSSSKLSNEHELEKNDPCWKERKMFYKCLNENGFDYKQCEVHQMNSKKCKDFWYRVQRDRMGKGIRPYMPDIDERIRIKQEYLQKKKEHCAANNKK